MKTTENSSECGYSTKRLGEVERERKHIETNTQKTSTEDMLPFL
jgi:hypothetical protein